MEDLLRSRIGAPLLRSHPDGAIPDETTILHSAPQRPGTNDIINRILLCRPCKGTQGVAAHTLKRPCGGDAPKGKVASRPRHGEAGAQLNAERGDGGPPVKEANSARDVEKRPEQARSRGSEWRVALRPALRRLLEPRSAEAQAERANCGQKVEHPFLAVREGFGYDKGAMTGSGWRCCWWTPAHSRAPTRLTRGDVRLRSRVADPPAPLCGPSTCRRQHRRRQPTCSIPVNPVPTYPMGAHDAKADDGSLCSRTRKGARCEVCKTVSTRGQELSGRRPRGRTTTATSVQLAVADRGDDGAEGIGGRAWPSVIFENPEHEYAFALWCNSTLGLLLHWWTANKTQSGRGTTTVTAIPHIPTLDVRSLTAEQHARAGVRAAAA